MVRNWDYINSKAANWALTKSDYC